ncbi:hypothetical protein AB1Y20_005993 [Prymnesium parvum]|uniref:UBA domain-containing protein n=1 Tax=Prymnesium parvum TaxID=97485 RepID=A0AB34J4H2_PRYPA
MQAVEAHCTQALLAMGYRPDEVRQVLQAPMNADADLLQTFSELSLRYAGVTEMPTGAKLSVESKEGSPPTHDTAVGTENDADEWEVLQEPREGTQLSRINLPMTLKKGNEWTMVDEEGELFSLVDDDSDTSQIGTMDDCQSLASEMETEPSPAKKTFAQVARINTVNSYATQRSAAKTMASKGPPYYDRRSQRRNGKELPKVQVRDSRPRWKDAHVFYT